MSKNIILKAISVISVSLFMLPMNVKASEQQNPVESVAQQYLTAIKEKNINKIIDLSKTDLGNNVQERMNDLSVILSDPNNQIKDFSILNSEKSSDFSIVNCRINYENGQIVEDQMKVIDKDSANTYVSVETVENSPEKVIKKGHKIPTKPNGGIRTAGQIASWSTAVDAGDIRYSGTFGTSQSYVDLNYRNGGNIRYCLVTPGIVFNSDASWAAETGPNPDSPDQVRLNARPGKSLGYVKLQISCWATPGGFSFGEVYA